MLSIEHFIISVFCIVEEYLKSVTEGQKLRSRGFEPSLRDSEVITMEIVGEFLGIDTDKGIWEYFRRHWRHYFPSLGSRATFVRQAANIWQVKQMMQRRLAEQLLAFDDDVHMVDGLPMPTCKFARAHFSNCFRAEAAYGYCASKQERYYGFRGHLIISLSGVVTGFTLTAANVDERDALLEITSGINGLIIGDKGYIRPALQQELSAKGIDLQTSLRSNMQEHRPKSVVAMLVSTRRLIETVIGQLSQRFHFEKIWARDIWHLTSRISRKLLAHTICLFLNLLLGREPLQFDGLVAA